MADAWSQFPDGDKIVTHVHYSYRESRGPLALAITAGISLLAVSAMLLAILITGFKTKHQFARSQVGAYFLSLALSDLLQAVGSLMNAKWVIIEGVSMGPFCIVQGAALMESALKQTGNVGTALWSLVIATHTFSLLFLRRRTKDSFFYCILFGVWTLIAFVVMMGPVLIRDESRGPFWGISGYWCWITDVPLPAYHVEQLTDEYLFMFLTASVSIVLYSLIFFKLRGNLKGSGLDMRFTRVKEPWVQNDIDDSQMSAVGKQMLWYPVAYTIIIVPIAVCRWSAIFGHTVPYAATMTADTIFMLSGFVNAILYSTTRKIVSVSVLLPYCRFKRNRSPNSKYRSRGASLDDMQFSIPVVSNGEVKLLSDHTSGGPADPFGKRPPRGGNKVPAPYRPPLLDSKHASWLTKSDGTIDDSYSENAPAEAYISPKRLRIFSPWRNNHISHSRAAIDHPVSELQEVIDIRKQDRDASESSSIMDGTPPLYRKRLSDWSLPSLRDVVRENSVHAELEEMRFATPSPEAVSKQRASPPDPQCSVTVKHLS